MDPRAPSQFERTAGHLRWRATLQRIRGEMQNWGGSAIAGLLVLWVMAALFVPLNDIDVARILLVLCPVGMVVVAATCVWLAREAVGHPADPPVKRMRGHREKYEFNRPWIALGVDMDTGEEITVPNKVGVDPHHILVAGATGIGKTVLFKHLWWQAAQGTGPCVFVNGKPKDTLINEVAELALKSGRWQDFRILDAARPTMSHGYDPFFGRTTDEQAGVFEFLYPYLGLDQAGTYYRELVMGFVPTVLNALAATGKRYTLEHAYQFFRDPLRWAAWMRSHFGGCKPVRDLVKDLEAARAKAYRDFLSACQGMESRLKPLCAEPLRSIFCPALPDFTMEEIFRNNLLLFVNMNVDDTGGVGRAMGRVLVWSLWQTIKKLTADQSSFKVDPPGLVILDECTSYMTKDLGAILSKTRESWVRVVLGAQEMGQFQDPARDGSRAILGDVETNAVIRVIGRQLGESALLASRLFGKQKKAKESWRVATGAGFGWPGSGAQGGGGDRRDIRAMDRTVQEEEGPAVLPEDVAGIPDRHALMAIQEKGPMFVRLYGIYGLPRGFVFGPDKLDRYRQAHQDGRTLLDAQYPH